LSVGCLWLLIRMSAGCLWLLIRSHEIPCWIIYQRLGKIFIFATVFFRHFQTSLG
jgi:hypothetical protein